MNDIESCKTVVAELEESGRNGARDTEHRPRLGDQLDVLSDRVSEAAKERPTASVRAMLQAISEARAADCERHSVAILPPPAGRSRFVCGRSRPATQRARSPERTPQTGDDALPEQQADHNE